MNTVIDCFKKVVAFVLKFKTIVITFAVTSYAWATLLFHQTKNMEMFYSMIALAVIVIFMFVARVHIKESQKREERWRELRRARSARERENFEELIKINPIAAHFVLMDRLYK